MHHEDLEKRKKEVIEFVKNNPRTTYKGLRNHFRMHIENLFKGGMAEIFKDAGIKPPRTFKRKTKEEKRKIIVDYIKKHPTTGGHIIRRDTKINFSSIFKSIQEAYKEAGVEYLREESYKKSAAEKKEELIKTVKENPKVTIKELAEKIKTNPYRFFKNVGEIYEKAGVKKIPGNDKRRVRKGKIIIEFIKANPLATQREINKICRTRIQGLFKRGIFEAYEKAGVEFPYERLKIYGIGLKEVRQRAKTFEEKIALKLSGLGKVNRLVKTKRGFADIILERKDKKAVIEVKDYELKEISISQIEQLNKYLEDCNCNIGFLVCYKKPKRDNFLMGKNKIFVLEETELGKIPDLMGL